MNKNKLKTYAPEARRDFIKAVTERAAFYGITEKKVFPCEIKGDFAFISGRPFPKDLDEKRKKLIARVEKSGFTQVMEEIAYMWFNRFMAIRFMEVNGYLSHGYRVLSHPEGHAEPELLEKAQFIEKLDGLEKSEIIKLKTAGGKESELYRRLLIAQCNELHAAMSFLFETVDDPTELLLPDNLLNTDSIIRQMVTAIPEEDWKEVEIVGWLYQFYISEKKDELMSAKAAYKTEDIPAVTQLFTPKWIVKYLVQNSLGAKWLLTYPSSSLKAKMEYYIEPAEQSDEVKAKLKEITPEALNPEELTVLDPACGSGHILVEAYDLLKEIYLERGYRPKDIPAFILTKNLYGLEIDERAAQLAGFALMMKARQDDRQIFEKKVKPNIICLRESSDIDEKDVLRNLESVFTGSLKSFRSNTFEFVDEMDIPLFAGKHNNRDVNEKEQQILKIVYKVLEIFKHAKTIGSLTRIPKEIADVLSIIEETVAKYNLSGDLIGQGAVNVIKPFIRQASVLSRRYDCVIANPPYLGGKWMSTELKEFAKIRYPETKYDLFAMFIERGFEIAKEGVGFIAMITQQAWMFLSSYEKLRNRIIDHTTITSMKHNGFGAFGADFGTTSFILLNTKIVGYIGDFISLREARNIEEKKDLFLSKKNRFRICDNDFKKIPGSPIAYWVTEKTTNIFIESFNLKDIGDTRQGCATSDNNRFLRLWHEVNYGQIGMSCASREEALKSRKKWFPYNKGGNFRRWYGNQDFLIDWENDGARLLGYASELYGSATRTIKSISEYFKPSISWSKVTVSDVALRFYPKGFIFDVAGCSIFFKDQNALNYCLGFLNSAVAKAILKIISPTLNYEAGHMAIMPILKQWSQIKSAFANDLVLLSRMDWDSRETSWGFDSFLLFKKENNDRCTEESYERYRNCCRQATAQMKQLEQENNRIFIEAYGLQDELTPDIPIEEITLFANPKYRYKGELTDDELEMRFKADTMKELISYSVGCMMCRYSLDVPGLVYAHAENKGFDPKKYKKFPAEEDGIIPITEREWFDDDAACRFFRFIETAWDKISLEENLDFIADAIGRKSSEQSREAIRRYFVNDFYKDHCQTYKNRPIYWLWTSGKEKAFQAIVYLHRYNEGTLARMRTEYVLPLQTKIARHIEHLEKDKDSASSASAGNKLQKEIDILRKHKEELFKFDERLRHLADMKIKLDLDDGVKVNYAKFGELLADVKKIAGAKEEKDESTD